MALVGERSLTAGTIIGVDLAWGERAPTGLCACDESGMVIASATAVRDEEIFAWIEQFRPLSTVAFDAPLIVKNETGMRLCEHELNRRFGRFHAGCYPTNLGLLKGRVRAKEIADALELTPGRSAIEVYPHSALVTIGGLDRVLEYKARPGRTLDSRRSEMVRLTELIRRVDGFDAASGPRWAELFELVTTAPTRAALRRGEDELDAHVCAIVGLLHTRGDSRIAVFGEPGGGEIVTLVDDRTRP